MATARVVLRLGDDVSTDIIYPGRFMATVLPTETPQHAFADMVEFNKTLKAGQVPPGSVLVAGNNFGCGSSREQAAVCIKMCDVRAIVARSFARIFFRNCVNNGVLPVVCPAAVEAIQKGDRVAVDLDAGVISTPRGQFAFPPLSPSVMSIIDAGGLIPMLRRKLGTEHLPMPEVKFGGGD